MNRRARVLVSGYYGFANSGDEAILAGLIAGFQQLAPEAELTVLSGDPEETTLEHGVRAVSRGFGSALSELGESDLLISGGGGLIQDATSWRSPLYYLGILQLARASRVPVACIGQSIGPLRRRWIRALTRYTLSGVAVLSVRDRLSEAALRALGLRREICVTSDLAFILPPPSAKEIETAWQKAGLAPDSRPAACIALREPPGAHLPDLPQRLAAALGPSCEQLDLRPVFLPMHHPGDVSFAERVSALLPMAADIVRWGLAARTVLALVGGCELVIAMRLHALAFARVCGKSIVAISYDPKVAGLLGDLGVAVAASTDSLEPEALGQAIVAAWRRRHEVAEPLAARAEDLRVAALRNVELALSTLRAGR